jgi:hypothetical protein
LYLQGGTAQPDILPEISLPPTSHSTLCTKDVLLYAVPALRSPSTFGVKKVIILHIFGLQ